MSWFQLEAVGVLAGIGFIMSLFIAGPAFDTGPSVLSAKTGIVLGSTLAGLIGWLSVRRIRE